MLLQNLSFRTSSHYVFLQVQGWWTGSVPTSRENLRICLMMTPWHSIFTTVTPRTRGTVFLQMHSSKDAEETVFNSLFFSAVRWVSKPCLSLSAGPRGRWFSVFIYCHRRCPSACYTARCPGWTRPLETKSFRLETKAPLVSRWEKITFARPDAF